ncbi:MAG: 4-hydroxybenzoate octaprenyltransferase [Alphaproteobacteria bacterium]
MLQKTLDFVNSSSYSSLLRLNRPIPILLVLFPALWSLTLAVQSVEEWFLYAIIMIIGAISIRGAGCVINDIWDRKLDATVARTKERPIASGKISVPAAAIVFITLGLVGFALLLFLNRMAIMTALIFIPLIMLYPLAKRFTNFPQVFLGITYNAGALIAWFAVDPRITYPPVLVYIAAALWTIGYDTIYGHQDKIDDAKAGMRSTSLYFGERTKDVVWAIYRFIGILLLLVGLQCHMGLVYYISIAGAMYHFYWQSGTVNLDDPADCAAKFNSNWVVGLIILVGMILGKVLPF